MSCACDPTGTGCHHKDCPVGKQEWEEHKKIAADQEATERKKIKQRREPEKVPLDDPRHSQR